jgi:hypothetical protein
MVVQPSHPTATPPQPRDHTVRPSVRSLALVSSHCGDGGAAAGGVRHVGWHRLGLGLAGRRRGSRAGGSGARRLVGRRLVLRRVRPSVRRRPSSSWRSVACTTCCLNGLWCRAQRVVVVVVVVCAFACACVSVCVRALDLGYTSTSLDVQPLLDCLASPRYSVKLLVTLPGVVSNLVVDSDAVVVSSPLGNTTSSSAYTATVTPASSSSSSPGGQVLLVLTPRLEADAQASSYVLCAWWAPHEQTHAQARSHTRARVSHVYTYTRC